ncbi:MAG: site-specific integrase, partial [candidate division Zixibacteria bacterium]|nr:site-specific integrase [candidate division Zixibacteria bacterium]
MNSASEEFRPILITALHTGMRRGEILSLKWSEVDFRNGIITVQESRSGRQRVIPIDETLYKVLYRLPSRFQKGYVFPSPVKLGKRRFDVLRQWRNVIKRAEIENVRFHDLRHSFAS